MATAQRGLWDDVGESIVEHVAAADDSEVAEATYRAAVALADGADHAEAGCPCCARQRGTVDALISRASDAVLKATS
jgi:hypothetical protein